MKKLVELIDLRKFVYGMFIVIWDFLILVWEVFLGMILWVKLKLFIIFDIKYVELVFGAFFKSR